MLQEVKTTGANDLTHANRLIEDYIKLFGTDAEVTLQTRLGVAANHMEALKIESEICCRTTEIGGISPETSSRVQLVPTLVRSNLLLRHLFFI